jgi:flagellar hook-basal body complex protein FliE
MAQEAISLIQSIQKQPGTEGMSELRRLRPAETGDESFADMIRDAVNSVDQMQKSAESSAEAVIAGDEENIHEVMIAMEKAQLSFQLMVEIRNRAVETYQELSRMQI